jgi:polyprenyldihydroxybenzoate methyltransferase/3-demethylubiquinol 3-O-methyltransferase
MARAMSTIDKKEIDHHSAWKDSWWDERNFMAPLHSINVIRLEFIKNGLANIGFKPQNTSFPLEGVKIADVGCGGGILSEYLAKVGAHVTGIDAASDLIEVAKEHVKLNSDIINRVDYVCANIEEFSQNNLELYDAIVCSQVLEHVLHPELFLKVKSFIE